jgi:hypothetical protein
MAAYGRPNVGDIVVHEMWHQCVIKRYTGGDPEPLGSEVRPEFAVAHACEIACRDKRRVGVWLTTNEFGYLLLAEFGD